MSSWRWSEIASASSSSLNTQGWKSLGPADLNTPIWSKCSLTCSFHIVAWDPSRLLILIVLSIWSQWTFLLKTETYICTEEAKRYVIDGSDLLCHTAHAKHGKDMYVCSDISDATPLSSTNYCDIIQVGGSWVANVHKAPSATWEQPVLPTLAHPAVSMGDFNSHHTDWGYSEPDADSEQLVEWTSDNDLVLVQNNRVHFTRTNGNMIIHLTSDGDISRWSPPTCHVWSWTTFHTSNTDHHSSMLAFSYPLLEG